MLAHTDIVDRQHQPARLGRVPESKPESLNSITDRMRAAANGDLDAATEAMATYLEGLRNPTHRAHVLRLGCRSLLGAVGNRERHKIKAQRAAGSCPTYAAPASEPASAYTVPEGTKRAIARLDRRILREHSRLFDMPYKVNGIDRRLGDMTGDQAVAVGRSHQSLGMSTYREGVWLERVGATAGERIIQTAITPNDIERIRRQVDELELPA